jgi:hypothetical protein
MDEDKSYFDLLGLIIPLEDKSSERAASEYAIPFFSHFVVPSK